MRYLTEIFLGLMALFSPPVWADGCTETSCVQSHVSTTGNNYFALSCTAQFANDSCEGRPLYVDVNRCEGSDLLSMSQSLDEKGKATSAGECGRHAERVVINCETACKKAGWSGGFCHTRSLMCFNHWRESSYCRCVD